MKRLVLILPIVALLALYTNCSESQSPYGLDQSSQEVSPSELDASGKAFLTSHFQCEFTLAGSKGAQWKVIRKTLIDDDCQSAAQAIRTNNPNASVVAGPVQIFTGADNGLASERNSAAHTQSFFYQCRFELKGVRGASWKVYRNTEIDDNCAAASAAVLAANPNATVVAGPEKVFIGGDNGFKERKSEAHLRGDYYECHFRVTRSNNQVATVIRRTDIDDNCAAAIAAIKTSNPNAAGISAPVKVFSGLDI